MRTDLGKENETLRDYLYTARTAQFYSRLNGAPSVAAPTSTYFYGQQPNYGGHVPPVDAPANVAPPPPHASAYAHDAAAEAAAAAVAAAAASRRAQAVRHGKLHDERGKIRTIDEQEWNRLQQAHVLANVHQAFSASSSMLDMEAPGDDPSAIASMLQEQLNAVDNEIRAIEEEKHTLNDAAQYAVGGVGGVGCGYDDPFAFYGASAARPPPPQYDYALPSSKYHTVRSPSSHLVSLAVVLQMPSKASPAYAQPQPPPHGARANIAYPNDNTMAAAHYEYATPHRYERSQHTLPRSHALDEAQRECASPASSVSSLHEADGSGGGGGSKLKKRSSSTSSGLRTLGRIFGTKKIKTRENAE